MQSIVDVIVAPAQQAGENESGARGGGEGRPQEAGREKYEEHEIPDEYQTLFRVATTEAGGLFAHPDDTPVESSSSGGRTGGAGPPTAFALPSPSSAAPPVQWL